MIRSARSIRRGPLARATRVAIAVSVLLTACHHVPDLALRDADVTAPEQLEAVSSTSVSAAVFGGPSLALGGGIDRFEQRAEGDAVTVHAGPQGGFHIYVSLRATALDSGSPAQVSLSVVDDRGRRIGWVVFRRTLASTDGGGHELVGLPLVLEIDAVSEVAGRPLEVQADIEDASGTRLHATRRWLAVAASSR